MDEQAAVVSAMAAAELQTGNPAALAAKWGEVFDRPVGTNAAGHSEIVLDDATLRFVPVADGRPEGLGGLDIATVDRRHRRDAGSLRRTVDMHGASATLPDSTSKLGTGQTQVVTNDPQQGRIRIPFVRNFLGIYLERHHALQPLPV